MGNIVSKCVKTTTTRKLFLIRRTAGERLTGKTQKQMNKLDCAELFGMLPKELRLVVLLRYGVKVGDSDFKVDYTKSGLAKHNSYNHSRWYKLAVSNYIPHGKCELRLYSQFCPKWRTVSTTAPPDFMLQKNWFFLHKYGYRGSMWRFPHSQVSWDKSQESYLQAMVRRGAFRGKNSKFLYHCDTDITRLESERMVSGCSTKSGSFTGDISLASVIGIRGSEHPWTPQHQSLIINLPNADNTAGVDVSAKSLDGYVLKWFHEDGTPFRRDWLADRWKPSFGKYYKYPHLVAERLRPHIHTTPYSLA